MNTMRSSKVLRGCSVCAAVLGTVACLSALPARAADDELPVDQKILRGIMEGLGLKRDGEPGITYQERSPLVIPPSRDLPPPEQTDAAAANAAWPKRRRKRTATSATSANASKIRCAPTSSLPAGARRSVSRHGPTTAIRRRHRASAASSRRPSSATRGTCSAQCSETRKRKRRNLPENRRARP